VLRLPESEGEGAYLAFHRSLSATQAWLNDEAVAGRQPSEAELAERFEEIWRAEGLSDTAHARVLRARGSALVRTARAEAVQAQRPRPKREMVAHLAAGRVRVVADQAEELPDGTLRLIDVRAGRPGADDHTDPRLALLRHAATQEAGEQPIELVIDYLATGERKSVKPAPRWEPARVEKYNAALASIHAGRFAPDPEPRKCAVCPFYLICPV
jgi:CRISPR/Cas system-associated exonuclease Cas4 (RecB family)